VLEVEKRAQQLKLGLVGAGSNNGLAFVLSGLQTWKWQAAKEEPA
jgi:hypothetical protein